MGLLSKRLLTSWLLAESSTCPRSRIRSFRPSGVRCDDDVFEFFRLAEPALHRQRDLQRLSRQGRGLPHLAQGDGHVLFANGGDHVGDGQAADGQLVGIEPDPHAVVALPEDDDLADPRQPRQFIAAFHQRVIAQIKLVVCAILRPLSLAANCMLTVSRMSGDRLRGRDSGLAHDGGKLRHGQRQTVLHQHLGQVQVHSRFERHGQRVRAVAGALRRHVQHVFHAVDLLLDRRRDRLGDDLALAPG